MGQGAYGYDIYAGICQGVQTAFGYIPRHFNKCLFINKSCGFFYLLHAHIVEHDNLCTDLERVFDLVQSGHLYLYFDKMRHPGSDTVNSLFYTPAGSNVIILDQYAVI